MDPYLRKLAGIPRLDATAEHLLAARAAAGDRSARERLIVASLSLVVMRAKAFGFHGQRLLDAVQAGTVGLIEAVDRFDPSRGCRLATYAWWWIGRAMTTALPASEIPLETDVAVEAEASVAADELLVGLAPALGEVLACRLETVAETGRMRSRDDVAARLGLSPSQVRTREAKALKHVRDGLAKVGDRASHQRGEADPL